MDATTVYAISSGALVAFWTFITFGFTIFRLLYSYFAAYLSRYILHHQLPRLLRRHTSATRLDLLLLCTYVAGNVTAIFADGSTLEGVERRTGHLALINLIPIGLIGRPNVLVNSGRILYSMQARFHKWIGMMVLAHSTTHSAIALCRNQRSLPGLIAGAGLIGLCIFMTRIFRQLAFEAARSFHIAVAITVFTALFVHAFVARRPKIYLIVSISLWVISLVLRGARIVYRSIGARAYILGYEEDDDVIQIAVDFKRPWKFGPGQYVYLTIPGISSTAVLQSHPFALAWWDQLHRRAFFLAAPRKGFTRNLLLHRSGRISRIGNYNTATGLIGAPTTIESPYVDLKRIATPLRAMIEGPYGQFKDLGSYGTVLMIATGLGIVGHLSYIKYLLEAHRNRQIRTQRICLYWQMSKGEHRHWVSRWMSELMKSDARHVLRTHMFITNSTPPHSRNDAPGKHEALTVQWTHADFPALIQSEVNRKQGDIVITVCADCKTKSAVYKKVGRMACEGVQLEELDFEL
ncbi:hypothetical protein BDD12DRAFT_459059 [Trichophaea hybrida]|nr:hypothetical protein BDD12DRAFT_459059 [Trichophaea hybrida]